MSDSTCAQPDITKRVAVTFHLTHRCNLRCTYCYTGDKNGTRMSPATAREAVDFAMAEAERQAAEHLDVVFFGGEPLLEAELLLDICALLRERWPHRLSIKLSTNGTLLDESLLQRLLAARVFISISIDGPPDIQAAQRPGATPRDWTPVVEENLQRLLEYNPCTNVNAVITPQSAPRIDETVRWLHETGFTYISTALDYGAEWTRQDLKAMARAYRRMCDWYYEQTLAGRKFYVSCIDERIRTWVRGPVSKCERCSLGITQFSIAPSGNLYPCVQFVQEDADDTYRLGDIRQGFDEQRRRAVHDTAEARKPECDGCAIATRCSSWCACVNWASTGRIDRASPLVCEHERMLMPIVDKMAARLYRKRNHLFLHKQYNPAFAMFSFVDDIVMKEERDASASVP